jgi:spore coat protein CotH
MWTTRQILATLSAMAVALGAVPSLGATDGRESDALFDDRIVHEIRVSMHSGDWARLRETYMLDTYYPADVSWDGHVVRNAGVRSRGFGSRDARKPGLKLDFNRYVSGQELADLKGVVLDNFRQDPAMLKETVSMRLFARMGLVTPRAVHARVFVNDEYLGLFAAIELVDKSFLRSTLGEDDGYLYDFEWDGEYRLTWLGGDPRAYASMFKPETHETQSPERVFGTLVDMITAVNRTSRDAWPQVLTRFFDVNHLMAYVAVESFLSDHDGLAGDWGINNFYLYRYAESERFLFIPWDKDVNFREPGRDAEAGFEGNPLLETALRYSPVRDVFRAALRRCAAIAAATSDAGPGWLEQEVGRQAAMIRTAAREDRNKAWSDERFEQEVAWMLAFARQRSGQVYRQVGGAP